LLLRSTEIRPPVPTICPAPLLVFRLFSGLVF